MTNYFRITGYYPEQNFCFIIDSNGMFEKLWQFSSFLIQKGLKVLEVNKLENIIDVNIEPAEEDNNHIFLRATANGNPEYIEKIINGIIHHAVKVSDKIYVINN